MITDRPEVPEKPSNDLREYCRKLAQRVNAALMGDGSGQAKGPVRLKNYTVATLPSASVYPYGTIYVTDESGGAQPATSDGTNWRRHTDRAVVS